jgi:hypothetical protein
LFLRIFQHPSYRKLPCAQRSNYTRRYSLRHPSWGTFPILTNRSDNSRCFFNTRFVGNLMCLESSILDRPPFNTRFTGNFMRCSSHKSLISFFQHPSYGKLYSISISTSNPASFNTHVVGNATLSLCGWPGYPAFNTLTVGNVRCSEWADRDKASFFNTHLTGN